MDKLSEHGFTNYMDFYEFVVDTYEDMNYIEVMRCYSGHFGENDKGQLPTLGAGTAWASSVTSKPTKTHEHHARLLPCVWVCRHVCGKTLQIHSVGRVRTAERGSLRSTILWLLRPQNSVTEDGRRKGRFWGCRGLGLPCPRRVGEPVRRQQGQSLLGPSVRSVA